MKRALLVSILFFLVIFYFIFSANFSWSPIKYDAKPLTNKEKFLIKSLVNNDIKSVQIFTSFDEENHTSSYIVLLETKSNISFLHKNDVIDKILKELYTKIIDNKLLYELDLIKIRFCKVGNTKNIFLERNFSLKDLKYRFGFQVIKIDNSFIRKTINF